jgi:thiol-disulfide isomerase/thioredoxin
MLRFTLIAAAAMLALPAVGCGDSSAPSSTSYPPPTPAAGTVEPGPSAAAASTSADKPGAGNTAAATPAEGADGVEVKILSFEETQKLIAGHKGKIVVVDCWSTWCEPCKKEFPGLVEIHKKYSEDVACVSVSFDYDGVAGSKPEDSRADVLAFLRKQGAKFDNVLSSVPADELSKKFEIAAIPVVFVYGRDGKLARKFDGADGKEFTYKSDIEPLVAALVKKPAESK